MERNPMTARLALSGPALASLHGRTVVQLGAPTHQADVPFFLVDRRSSIPTRGRRALTPGVRTAPSQGL